MVNGLITLEDLVKVDALKNFANKASTEEAEEIASAVIKILFQGEVDQPEGIKDVGMCFKVDDKGNLTVEELDD